LRPFVKNHHIARPIRAGTVVPYLGTATTFFLCLPDLVARRRPTAVILS
jgi:hypothetical protein